MKRLIVCFLLVILLAGCSSGARVRTPKVEYAPTVNHYGQGSTNLGEFYFPAGSYKVVFETSGWAKLTMMNGACFGKSIPSYIKEANDAGRHIGLIKVKQACHSEVVVERTSSYVQWEAEVTRRD